MADKWKEFEAATVTGEKRCYNIKLMDCETGLRLWHSHFAVIMDALPELLGNIDEDSINLMSTGYTIVTAFEWDLLKDFAAVLLSGATVTVNDVEHKLDDSGFGDVFSGDPQEFYTALYHAAMANYKPLIAQLSKQLKKNKAQE